MEGTNHSIFTEEYDKQTETAVRMAVEIVKDEKKLHVVWDKVYGVCESLTKIPVIGEVFEDIVVMADMIQAYLSKEYTQIPVATIMSFLAALIYLISPLDIVPDYTPIIGYVDDGRIIKFTLQALQMDLEQYKQWKCLQQS